MALVQKQRRFFQKFTAARAPARARRANFPLACKNIAAGVSGDFATVTAKSPPATGEEEEWAEVVVAD
jgi:hypothetical protein